MNKNVVAASILRVVLGFTFLMHGIAKFSMSLENVSGWFVSIGLPGWLAYLVAFLELLGGIALILGVFVRYTSVALGAVLLGAIFTAKLSAGFLGNGQMAGYELDVALLAMALYFAVSGGAGYSLSQVFKKSSNA